MTVDEILAKFPTSTLIQLVNPYEKTCRFVREDEWGQYDCDPPSDWRRKFDGKASAYKPVVRRKMGREVIA